MKITTKYFVVIFLLLILFLSISFIIFSRNQKEMQVIKNISKFLIIDFLPVNKIEQIRKDEDLECYIIHFNSPLLWEKIEECLTGELRKQKWILKKSNPLALGLIFYKPEIGYSLLIGILPPTNSKFIINKENKFTGITLTFSRTGN